MRRQPAPSGQVRDSVIVGPNHLSLSFFGQGSYNKVKAETGRRIGVRIGEAAEPVAMSGDQSYVIAAQICDQICSVFSSPPPSYAAGGFPQPLEVLGKEIVRAAHAARRIFVHGVGREGLMLKALCMRLFHVGLSAHVVGDVTTPPIGAGDLLLCSAGPGGFSTVDAICRVARSAGARVVLLTAQPGSGSEACRLADAIAYLPARTMADDEDGAPAAPSSSGDPPAVKLPMGSLYEGAMFVLFEMLVIRLAEELGRTPAELRSRHTNLE
ncbi:hypothetical protein AXF42_Ash018625 [Apostasia shenzhenica]|uniref:SIS domain-containing protein n=1 Tax=Apostasia shenzhenica TaxID=1088818 RepID=A0A2I0B1J5_9ASPA|nr:hypothetical protein AXF42_Ash018625 [Apostasia shenzhenica]